VEALDDRIKATVWELLEDAAEERRGGAGG
jgi:hypothetical protein